MSSSPGRGTAEIGDHERDQARRVLGFFGTRAPAAHVRGARAPCASCGKVLPSGYFCFTMEMSVSLFMAPVFMSIQGAAR
jgi:hypothetical protein